MANRKATVTTSHTESQRLIRRAAAGAGVALSTNATDGLLAYFELLLRWGERINLTAARSVATLASEHLPDALAIASRLARREERAPGSIRRLVDAGSGGGLPAIPLALLRTEVELVLVEATAKKAAFLRTAVRELGLEGRVQVENRRVERQGESPGEGAGFDGATSRAMVSPEDWLPMGRILVRPGGIVFCLSARAVGAATPGLELLHETSYQAERWLAELQRST